jgi:hypothetical protein
MNLSHYMPCFDGVECDDYALPKNARHAVNAGHFSWGETWKLARHNKLRGLQSRHNFTCLTTYREPVSRLISYFQYYHPEVFNTTPRCFNTLTEGELRSLLFEQLDQYGFSPINEPFRILSGVTDEDLLERAGFADNNKTGEFRPHFSPSDAVLLADTLAHVAKCTNYVVEVDNATTARMLQTRLPDLFEARRAVRQTAARPGLFVGERVCAGGGAL